MPAFLANGGETGQVAGVYCLLPKTTEKRLTEQRRAQAQKQQAFQVEISDALRDAAEPEPMMALAAQKLGQYFNAAGAGYARGMLPRASAVMGSPLIVNDRLVLVLFVVDSRPRVWLDCEKALIEEVAARTWISQRRLLAENNLRLMNAMLEQRMTELLRSETALCQSQKLGENWERYSSPSTPPRKWERALA